MGDFAEKANKSFAEILRLRKASGIVEAAQGHIESCKNLHSGFNSAKRRFIEDFQDLRSMLEGRKETLKTTEKRSRSWEFIHSFL